MSGIVEQWRPVVGYEGFYEVSDQGRVRSLDRLIATPRAKSGFARRKGRIMATIGLNSQRYLFVRPCKGGQPESKAVHRVVLEAFSGPCPEGMEAAHNNGNSFDNRISNLRWDTKSRNNQDKWLHGTQQYGEAHPNSKLTEQDVKAIRASTESYQKLAHSYGVHKSTISFIKTKRNWNWLD